MKVISLIVSFGLFIGALLLFGYASEFVGWEAPTFIGGILAMALAFGIPMHVLGKFD